MSTPNTFLPTTIEEIQSRNWSQLDVILITGDSYIDSPFVGVAIIGRVLEKSGYKVGIIAQPDITTPDDIMRLGEPRLFWGVTAGSVDSMIANYTASNKKRKNDDFTPGGLNNRRPDRAVIVYSNLIRRYYKNTVPIILGGIESSLRRIAHYDYWSNSIRRSILFDSKADYIMYGMAEQSIISLASLLDQKKDIKHLRGLCYIAKELQPNYIELPSYEKVVEDRFAFINMFHTFYQNNDPLTAKGLIQRHGDRFLVQNSPYTYPSQSELDEIYALPFQRSQHPYYEKVGKVKALETIRFSITTHRGCYGECNFCAIAIHEGRTVRWRSGESVLDEAQLLTKLPGFKGNIHDVGGPSANMYGFECRKKLLSGTCEDRRCIYPVICPALKPDHHHLTSLLRKIERISGIKKVFVASGIRYDMIFSDKKHGMDYLEEIVTNHVSGQLKIAPEHTEDNVLRRMGKTGKKDLLQFKNLFDDLCKKAHKEQYLTYYFIAAHPGCTDTDMYHLKEFSSQILHISPEQVQIFTPSPSTYSSLMYYTELDPFTLQPLYVEKDSTRREHQKQIIIEKPNLITQKKQRSYHKK